MWSGRACFMLLLAYVSAGCVSPVNIKPEKFPLSTDPRMKALDGTWHSVRILQATNTPVVSAWNRINPVWWFGNADQPKPPADYLPGRRLRNLRWHIRNPIHNFGHYVIGIGDKDLVRSGRFPARLSSPQGGWTVAVCKRGHVRLPFVDYRHGRFEFYFGWRTGGNFGIKFNLRQTPR